jgi:hypothetical protein
MPAQETAFKPMLASSGVFKDRAFRCMLSAVCIPNKRRIQGKVLNCRESDILRLFRQVSTNIMRKFTTIEEVSIEKEVKNIKVTFLGLLHSFPAATRKQSAISSLILANLRFVFMPLFFFFSLDLSTARRFFWAPDSLAFLGGGSSDSSIVTGSSSRFSTEPSSCVATSTFVSDICMRSFTEVVEFSAASSSGVGMGLAR